VWYGPVRIREMLCAVLSQAPSDIAVLLPHIATYGDLLTSESRPRTRGVEILPHLVGLETLIARLWPAFASPAGRLESQALEGDPTP
jgi:hypothetical protein